MADEEKTAFRSCRTTLRKVCPEAAALTDSIIHQVLFSAASKGNLHNLILMMHDIFEGRTPIEVQGGVRRTDESLSYETFLATWEQVYLGSTESTKKMMTRLQPLLKHQLGLVEVVVK